MFAAKTCVACLLFLLLIAGRCDVFGQANYYIEEPKKFSGGLIAGANFAQVDGDTFYGYHKVGLNAGATVYVHFTENIGMSLELIYSQKGSRGVQVLESAAIGTYPQQYYMDLNYVEVPLLFHIISHQFDLELGGSYGRLVKSNEYVFSDPPVFINPTVNVFKNTDIDYIFGLSHRVYKKLFVNARFQYSLFPIRDPGRIPIGFGYGNSGQFNNLCNLRFIYYL